MVEIRALGVMGTGLMGSAMTRRFLQQGFQVHVYNRTAEKTDPLRAAGALVAASVEDLVDRTPVTLSMLRDHSASEQLLLDSNIDWMNRQLIQMATIGVDESKSLARHIEERGGKYLEAPVLGSIPQTLSGELMIMAGGERQLFDAHQSLLQVLAAKELTYVGPVGSAAAMKLAFNQLIVSLTAAFAASHAFLKKEDVPLDLFMSLLRKSALYAPTFDKKLSMMNARRFDTANFSLENMHKDLRLIEGAFKARGISTQALKGVQAIVERAMDKRLEQADYSALYEGVFMSENKG